MTRYDNPVVWAGVVLRMADGTTHAWEFAEGLEQAEFTIENEGNDAFGRWWVPFGDTIDVRLRASRATYWREGAGHARPPKPPQKAIADAPREIEQ